MHSRALLATLWLLLATLAPAARSAGDELQDIAQLIDRKQPQQASARLDDYLRAHPQDSEARFLQGVALSELKQTDAAIRVFSELTRKHPSWPEPYNNLAVLYAGRGEFERARQTLETALRTHPSYAAVHDNLSGIYAAMASEAYGKALKTGTAAPRAQPRLAMVTLPSAGKPPMILAAAPQPVAAQPVKPVMTVSERPSTPVAPAKPAAAAPVPAPAKAETPRPAPPIVKAEVDVPADDGNAVQEVENTVKGWAQAWSRQNVDGYLDYYAASFKTPKGENRREWEKQRRSRIKAPKSIEVAVSNIKTEIDGNRATASFKQSYRADRIAKRTSKTLILQKRGDRWLIVQELAR